MKKFILTNIGLHRTPSKLIKNEGDEMMPKMTESRLVITLEYVGCGDTTELTSDELIGRFINDESITTLKQKVL